MTDVFVRNGYLVSRVMYRFMFHVRDLVAGHPVNIILMSKKAFKRPVTRGSIYVHRPYFTSKKGWVWFEPHLFSDFGWKE